MGGTWLPGACRAVWVLLEALLRLLCPPAQQYLQLWQLRRCPHALGWWLRPIAVACLQPLLWLLLLRTLRRLAPQARCSPRVRLAGYQLLIAACSSRGSREALVQ